MGHFDLHIPIGSVLDPKFYPSLVELHEKMASIKEEKLLSRHNKLIKIGRVDCETNVREVWQHLISEVDELGIELETGGGLDKVLREIADVINCAEIIGACLLMSRYEGY